MPVLPVTLVGIAVSLYVGFSSASADSRCWEAREAVGGMLVLSSNLIYQVQSLDSSETAEVPCRRQAKDTPQAFGLGFCSRSHAAPNLKAEVEQTQNDL